MTSEDTESQAVNEAIRVRGRGRNGIIFNAQYPAFVIVSLRATRPCLKHRHERRAPPWSE
jgi:hypothetical protein